MNPSDISAVLQWWIVLVLLGVGFAPLTFRLFSPFFDKGYLFSKLIGLFLVGYVVFVLSVFHIATFSYATMLSVSILLPLAIFLMLKQKWKFWHIIKTSWFNFAIEEAVFLAVLMIWAYIHSFQPDIHGLEKFMDYGFVNSFLRSDYLPPKDMWFPPYTINYYYFGHMLTAILTRLSGLPSYITFNLMLSSIVAFCFTETFSLGANLYYHLNKNEKVMKFKLAIAGILSACLVTFAGNLHIIYAFFQPYKNDNPQPFWQLPFKPFSFPNEYWYPNATRYIYHTIHEFPMYSWTVADLHGHVLDIPFVLLIIAFLFSLFVMQNEKPAEERISTTQAFLVHPLHLLFIGLVLACMYMTNAWDGAIYWMLAALVLLVVHGQKKEAYKRTYDKEESVKVIKNARKFSFPRLPAWKIPWGRDLLLSVLVITAALLVFSTPYNIHFKPFASGIGVLCAPNFLTKIGKIGPFLFEPDHCQRSYWWELLTLYGFFFYFVIGFGIFIIRSTRQTLTDIFVFLLIVLSLFLILAPEFVYLKDIYPTYYRANTMFKLVFQAFMMLGICSGYVIVRMASLLPYQRMKQRILILAYLIIAILLVCLVMIYPYFAVTAYYNDFKTYDGLNGITYLKTLYPDDYAAIQWFNSTIKGQPVILEAQGDSYTDYARISANTGLPTVLGWTVHEWLWRGTYDIPAPRITEVQTIYTTTDPQVAKTILDKYHVQYVYIGSMEFQKYPTLNEEKFKQLGKIVYHHGATRIYQLNQ